MTPLALRLFRNVKGPLAEPTRRELAASQFFECSALSDMAFEMRFAQLSTGYSEMAQLPAPRTVLEAVLDGQRFMFACWQGDDGFVQVNCMLERATGVAIVWQAAFLPGTKKYRIQHTGELGEDEKNQILIELFLVECFLCIINQPGLVDRRPRDTDKRAVREAASVNLGRVPPKWHECRIRPGYHNGGSSPATGEGREHQLHYVRKYFKPSIQKWVEGYWRGNADLGIYLKWYSPRPPADGGATP